MNINLAYSFVALCKHKNISLASKELNISQQGLSKQIQTLEKEFGLVLFDRSNTGVELTAFGVRLLPLFQNVIDSYEEILNTVSEEKNSYIGTIKLGLPHSVISAIGLEFILSFNKIYPNIKIEISELYDDECFDLLVNNKLDYSFLVAPFDESKIKGTLVFSDKPLLAINNSHEYAKNRTNIKMDDLNNQSLLCIDRIYSIRRAFDLICEEKNINTKVVLSVNTIASYINLIKNTNSICVIYGFLTPYIDKEKVTVLPLEDGPDYNVYFCSSKKGHSNIVKKKFFEFLKEHFESKSI